jgi:hypothetical protein
LQKIMYVIVIPHRSAGQVKYYQLNRHRKLCDAWGELGEGVRYNSVIIGPAKVFNNRGDPTALLKG